MTPDTSPARVLAERARQVVARIRPGSLEGRRSLPIRATAEDIRARWDDPATRSTILRDIPVAEASLTVGDEDRDWGRTTTISLQLSAPVPGMATQALTGKAVRRLKALCETGEIPSTDHNPSARSDAGAPAS